MNAVEKTNLDLWHLVEKTPTEHTKKITGKSYQGTSPKPHYLIKKATETFGPVGLGWGFSVEERVESGAMIEKDFYEKLHIAKVKVWYKWNGERGEVEHIGGTVFSGRYSSGKTFTDEDAPKKSVTDALVKALSMIGFAGDIFMGRYDDSKYVSELNDEAKVAAKKEAAAKEPEVKPTAENEKAYATLKSEMQKMNSKDDLRRWIVDSDIKVLREQAGPELDKKLREQDIPTYALTIPKPKKDVLDDIQDTFPGAKVVNDTITNHPLNAG